VSSFKAYLDYVIIDETNKQVTNEAIAYFFLGVKPFGLKLKDYPDEADIGFLMKPTYTLKNADVPIDTTNTVPFQYKMPIDNDLVVGRWLTKNNIQKSIDFINDTIKVTEDLTKFSKNVAFGTMLGCGAMRLWQPFHIALFCNKDDMKDEEKNECVNKIKKATYYVCDRVACSSSPEDCKGAGGNEDFFETDGNTAFTNFNQKDQKNANMFSSDGEKVATVNWFKMTSKKPNCVINGKPGVYVNGDVTKKEKEGKFFVSDSNKQYSIIRECVPVNCGKNGCGEYDKTKGEYNKEISSVNLKGIGGVCYSKGAPNFDETRCFGKAGWDPNDNLIESLMWLYYWSI
jgi:hypothetical protein